MRWVIFSISSFDFHNWLNIEEAGSCSYFNYDKITTLKIISMEWWWTMNCFCGMVDRRKAFMPYSQPGPLETLSLSQISNTPLAGFQSVQSLSSDFVEWSFAVVITTTPRCHGATSVDFLVCSTLWNRRKVTAIL